MSTNSGVTVALFYLPVQLVKSDMVNTGYVDVEVVGGLV